MNQQQRVWTSRQIRKAFGLEGASLIAIIDQRSKISAGILRRGFFGRLRWLLLGR